MALHSKIEWTEATWNPTTGCTKISPGCKNCYAESMSRRLKSMNVAGYENGFDLTLLPNKLKEPTKRKKSTIYFVNSMSDLFHEEIPQSFIREVFHVISQSPQHIFQILTKRAERLYQFCQGYEVPDNAWLGVSVEDKIYGIPRIDLLRKVDARIRFLSIEPLLEDLGKIDLQGIQWVIVGGESGPRARPMNPAWAIGIRDQCIQSGIPFFFKQWGAWGPDGKKRSKKLNGRLLEGHTWDEIPTPVDL